MVLKPERWDGCEIDPKVPRKAQMKGGKVKFEIFDGFFSQYRST